MHRRFGSRARLGAVAAGSVALGGLMGSGLLSASAQTRPAPPYAYTGLFKNAAEPRGADAAFLAKAQRENPHSRLELRPATLLPTAVDGVRAFAVRSAKGPACPVIRFTTSGGPVGGGYGVACPSEGGASGAVDFVSPGGSFGIVPDDVTTVSYTFAGGDVRPGKVTDNLWQAPLDATGVSFTEAGTARDLTLMPASSLPEDVRDYGGGLIAGRDSSAARKP